MEDTQKELQRLEQELLETEALEEKSAVDKAVDEIFSDEQLMREVMSSDAVPAFDDPDKIHEPEGPMVYCNYSNDYGKEQQETAEAGEAEQKKKDKTIIGLMIAASALCLGIMGILLYWLLAFLN